MSIDSTVLKAMAWCGVAFVVILVIGQWLIAGFVPPPSPHNTLAQTVRIYTEHQHRIQIGLIIAAFGAALLGPFSVALACVMRPMERDLAPLTWLQIAFGALLVIEFLIPIMMWQAAAFRPTADPEITYRLHDLGSITYDGLPMTAAIQTFILGVAILRDHNPVPILPRWLAYLSFWTGIAFLPGAVDPLFHSGPLAWNGLLAWWVGLVIFGLWLGVTTVLMHRAITTLDTKPRHSA